MWLPPGAINARPGMTRSLSAASLTSIWQIEFRRAAKLAVNFSGMCCTTTIPGVTRGNWLSTASSACVPPVDVPTATIRSVVCAMAFWPVAGNIASTNSFGTGGAGAAPPFSALRLATAADLMANSKSSAASCRKFFRPIFGLVMIDTAPADSACIVVSAPRSVRVEQTTTAVGRSLMIFFKKVMPSMRGISISSVITSGQFDCIFSRANSGSGAVPTSSMAGSALSRLVMT